MTIKEQTIVVRISRDELVKDIHRKNQVIVGQRLMKEMRAKGIPVIGVLAPFGVEHGKMATHTEDGLDGDELVYTWTGVPLAPELRKHEFTFSKTLADVMREENEI